MLCLQDFEIAAQRKLPRPIYGFIAGAAEDNAAYDNNRNAFARYRLTTRVLRNVSGRSQSVELFGERYTSPFGIAPMGIVGLSTYRGDMVLANTAQQAGILSILSATSLVPMEDVAASNPNTWFQAYLPAEQERIDALMDRVARAGFRTLVVSVDANIAANRENNVRAGFSTPLRPSLKLAWDGLTRPRWTICTLLRTLLCQGMPHFENSFATRGAPIISATAIRDFSARDHITWAHIRSVRQRWHGNLVIKGILSVEDALEAQKIGADGIILSNHGGRQLDYAASPLQILPQVTQAVGPAFPIMLDGGIRRGTDVLKAIALGAHMVFIGRPFNYAAAVAGTFGVSHAIELLRAEIQRDLGMLGLNDCKALGPHLLIKDS